MRSNPNREDAGGGIDRRALVQALSAVPFLGAFMADGAVAMPRPTDRIADLDGAWQIALDPADIGITRRWFATRFGDRMMLPGSLVESGRGNDVGVDTPWTGDINDRSYFTDPSYAAYRQPGNIKVPFFLQPEHWYRGAAWFQRDIDIPTHWRGKRVTLFLERPHWETRVWLDDALVGRCEALHVPHDYDLGIIAPGRHRLTIRVDNRMIVEIGHNGHGVTDHTQGNWNGIAGRIDLAATAPIWFDDVQLYPDRASRTLLVRGRLGNASGKPGKGMVDLRVGAVASAVPVSWTVEGGRFDHRLDFADAPASVLAEWDEFSPHLHTLEATLDNGERWAERFGWRSFAGTAHGFTVNGRRTMLRGALECSIFPLTGHPSTRIDDWRRIMATAKAHGLNHLRFHSYCPPEAAFDAADEAGVYVQIETVWANQSVAIGDGLPVDRWVYAETDRILRAHGNHPCFVMMTHGNEPGAADRPDGEAKRDAFLAGYVRHYRARDARRLWTSGSGWPELAENDYHVTPTPRIQQWGEELNSRLNADPPETRTDYRAFVAKRAVPVVSHEIGQWCVYPDLAEMPKYRGYLHARNFEIFRDRLRASGLESLAPAFLQASGKLQAMCYKEEIESALRTPGMGGFQLLGLQDFPGQGTALVGVVDPFWDAKGYIAAARYRRFCGPTVALARLARRVAISGQPFSFDVDIAHFGAAPLADATVAWRIVDDRQQERAAGGFAPQTIAIGNDPLALRVDTVLRGSTAAALTLVVSVTRSGRMVTENDWALWLFPDAAGTEDDPGDVLVTNSLDDRTADRLAAGGTVLVGLDPSRVRNFAERPVKLGFSSIFWNTLWTQRQAPTTLGILCDPSHPALAAFPTRSHSDWQWWYIMHRAGALRLDALPAGTDPIVRVIDDWFTARPLALIVELAVGPGRLIVCGFGLDPHAIAGDPVSRQLRRSLLDYMHSDRFAPKTTASLDQVRALAVPA